MTLTKRQRKILEYIRAFCERRGYSPTLAEIGRHFGLSSPATVHKHLANLEQRGALRRRSNASRAIEILPETGSTQAYDLPLKGTMDGGRPLVLEPSDLAVPVPPGLVGSGHTYVLRVRGDAFRDELMRDGDLVVIEDVEAVPEDGLALVLTEAGRPLLCRPERARGRAQAGKVSSEPFSEDRMRLKGRVLGILRRY